VKSFKPDHFLGHIQGLRAIAVLLVVVFHFWPGRLSGGYIGVDVFFVISGFLITGQLVRELQTSATINLPAFWAKRIRRLIPAALLILIFSAIATAVLMPLSYLVSSLTDISTSMLYVENWQLVVASSDYLHNVNGTIGQHYWSLSVEEQFYVVWPLILLGAFALGTRFAIQRRWGFVVAAVIGFSVLSLIASIFYTATNPSQAYFVLFTRVFEFGAGALLVLFPRMRPQSFWLSNILGFVGVLVLLVAGYKFTQSTPFPSYWALVPVIGTMLIIVIKPGGRWFSAGRILSIRPLRFLGDISYSLYLWHWPLIFIAPFIIGWGLSFVNRVILFVACFVLAWLTKRFVEDPLRQLPTLVNRKPRYTFGWMLVSLGVVGALLVGIFAVQYPRFEQAKAQLAEVQAHPPACFGAEIATGCSNPALADQIIPNPGFGNADEPSNPECFVQLTASALHPCTFGSSASNAPRVALVGDSHAYQYLNTFIIMAKKNGWALTTYFKGACPWTTAQLGGTDPGFDASCVTYRANLATELPKQKFDVIITSAFAHSEYVDPSATAVTAGFVEAWKTQAGGARVIAIADNPDMQDDPNKCLRSDPGDPSTCDRPRADVLDGPDPLVAAAAASGNTSVDFTEVFCDADLCFPVISGANVYRDENHLTVTFANTTIFRLQPAIVEALERGRN
jgi:peptidoglycan/LPS O-acetylase OafA/YrhL